MEDEDPNMMGRITLRHPTNHSKFRSLGKGETSAIEPLLVDVLQDGKLLVENPDLETIRERRIQDVERLDPGVRRMMNPHIYHVSLTQKLWDLKQGLITTTLKNEFGG